MKFEYYAVLHPYGFRQCGPAGTPQLFKNKATANRIARYSVANGRPAVVVTLLANVTYAEKPADSGGSNNSHYVAIKEQFPGAF